MAAGNASSTVTATALRDGFRGALVGTFLGDALGMPMEGRGGGALYARHGVVREMLDLRMGRGTYTDDTQLMIGLAEALLETPGDLDCDRVAARFAANYEPRRGYGGNARRILAAIARGEPWRQAVESRRLPGGSWANGAAMRVCPVALAFFGDRERIAAAAEEQAEVTGHSHPLGRFGARLQALAVHRALERGAAGRPFGRSDFLAASARTAPVEFRRALEWIGRHLVAEPGSAARALGTGSRASRSVTVALWAFLSRADEPEEAIVRAVNLGGDSDTIGAMTGALAGAFHGYRSLPGRWLAALENGDKGRDYVVDLADRLAQLVSA